MIVMKFGGTSVENDKAINRVAEIVRCRLEERPVVVVSAMAGVTDALLAMSGAAASGSLPEALKLLRKARQRHLAVLSALVSGPREAAVRQEVQALLDSMQDVLRGVSALGELTPRTTDNILAVGELLSSRIVTAALAARGIDAALVDSRHCIVTDATHTRAVPLFDHTSERLRHHVKPLLRQPGSRDGWFHRSDSRGCSHHPRPRWFGLLGRHHRRGAECPANRDLDRRRRNDDHRSAAVPAGATHRCHRIRRSIGAGVLRREGTAPGDADSRG